MSSEDESPLSSVVHVQDLTERHRAQAQLTRAATHDPLTRLPNRALLRDRLELALAQRHRRFALLLVDLDHFKVINDSLGHLVGDNVPCEVAQRLSDAVRPGDTVARLGGDEFVILCPRAGLADIAALCERVADRLSAPMPLDGHTTAVGASIGVALSQAADSDADSLLRDADTAMYAAKRSGRSRYAIFDAGMRATALARMDIESGLRSGLGRGEFFAHYQPIFDLHTGRAVAVEALMRWQRPTGPLVGPDGFLEVAEQTGLITTLGRHVTLTACRQVAQWRGDGMPDLTLSLNVSPQQLALTNFSDQFIELLGEADLSPEAVMLEITEHTLMLANTDDLERLRERGVRIALDDFGTGFSSLAYLQRLPVDVLKTDRTFLAHSNADGGRLLGSIIRLAEALELRLVVEGVETGAELRRLLSCGGHLAQGYGLARPGPASTLRERAEMTPSI